MPGANGAVHLDPQSIPAGELVTVPVPDPVFVTVSEYRGPGANVAATLSSWLSVTEQAAVPAQPPPDQPANVEPEAGVAVRVTVVPPGYCFEHVPGQEIPEPVTVPEPEPVVLALSVRSPPDPPSSSPQVLPELSSYAPTALQLSAAVHDTDPTLARGAGAAFGGKLA